MNPVPAWFERSFDFDFPIDLYPNLCARLRGTPARLEETVRGYSPELLHHKPQQKWSAQEHAGHLLDLDPLWTSRVVDYLNGSTVLTVADLTNRKTSVANHNARPLEQILAQFRAAREQFLQQVQEVNPKLFSRAILHPRMQKPMRFVDHLYFVAEHDDHHLALIWQLLHDKRSD